MSSINQPTHQQFLVADDDDEIRLADLVRVVWRGRGVIAGTMIACMLAVASFYGMRFLTVPSFNEYSISIRFAFDGAEKGEYPNGSPFLLSDILSTRIVSQVFKEFELDKTGLTTEEFSSRLTIQPLAINRMFIDARFKERLGVKGLSRAEVEDLEQAYTLELNAAVRGAAALRYIAPSRDPIPRTLIEKILFRIPEVWSTIAVKEQGVLDLPVTTAHSFNIDMLNDLEYVTAVALVRDDLRRMDESLKRLGEDDRLALIRDKVEGRNLFDLRKDIDTLLRYQVEPTAQLVTSLGLVRNRAVASNFLESRLQEINDRVEEMGRMSRVYQDALQAQSQASAVGVYPTMPAGGGVQTQLGDQFLGQLMKLGDQISESQYRQSLLDSRIDLDLKMQTYLTDERIFRRQLDQINSTTDKSQESNQSGDAMASLERLFRDFAGITGSYGDLLESARTHALSSTRSLYELMQGNVRASETSMTQLRKLGMLVVLGAFVGGIFGVFALFIRSAMRIRARERELELQQSRKTAIPTTAASN